MLSNSHMRGASFLTVASQLNITSRLSRKRSLDSLCAACIVSRQYASKQRTGEKYASVVPSKPKQASPHLELPSVSKTLKMFELQAEKRLSQHFIVDAQVTDKLARLMGDLTQSVVIEIGAGPGAMTRSLLNAGAKRVVAIEIDQRFKPPLQMLAEAAGGRLQVLFMDALKYDWRCGLEDVAPVSWEDASPVKVAGNMPYSVATEIVLRLLRDLDRRQGVYALGRAEAYFVMQQEVVQRFQAGLGDKERSKLSILVNRLARFRSMYTLRGHMFVPPTKVTSSFFSMVPHINPPTRVTMATAERLLPRIIGTHGNKQLRNGLSNMLWHLETNVREAAITEILQHSGAGGTERLHQLDPEAIEKMLEIVAVMMSRPGFEAGPGT